MSSSAAAADNSQWVSITEESLLLHDGLMRVTDFVELPQDDVTSTDDKDQEVVTFDSKSPEELTEWLLTVCSNHNNAYARLLEYRLNGLKGFWKVQFQLALEEHNQRESASNDETIAMLKKHGLWKEPEQASFSTRVSLLLCLPLLQSQSRTDPRLSSLTTELLLNCLRDCPPLSLGKEPSDCLNGIESLLSSWLGEGESDDAITNPMHRQTAASALVALACARGDLKTFVHAVHLLQQIETDVQRLPAADILLALQEVRGGQSQPTSLLGSKHAVSWGYEEMLINVTNSSDPSSNARALEYDVGRDVACDGKFLFITNSTGCGLIKIGTGLHGTLRGYNYSKNSDIGQGRLAWGQGLLLHRLSEFDRESSKFACLVDQHSLQLGKTLQLPAESVVHEVFTTIALCSDGSHFYWIWCAGSISDKAAKNQNIILDVLSVNPESLEVQHLHQVTLAKKDDSSSKVINDSLLSRLRPFRGPAPPASTLVSLTTNDATATTKKEDTSSTGVTTKALMRSPIYCDGNSIVLLTPSAGASSASQARSLFGSSAGISGLRSLATNVCFSVQSGQCSHRTDLIDAPACSLARGASLLGMGLCYDASNNLIWGVSADWVDQFLNPGHRATLHIMQRLCLPQDVPLHVPADKMCSTSEALAQLLRHIGSMSVQHVSTDASPPPPLSATALLAGFQSQMALLQEHTQQVKAVDLVHLQRVLDILQRAVKEKDERTVICMLLVMQLMFKTNVFQNESEEEKALVQKCSDLLWLILSQCQEADVHSADPTSAVLREVSLTISTGLTVLYPLTSSRDTLFHKLLSEGDQVKGYMHLRNLILINYSEQLRSQLLHSDRLNDLRLNSDLVQLVLKIVVRESCALLRECQTSDRVHLEAIITSVPMASACLRYLMALQFHSLRFALLQKEFSENSVLCPDFNELSQSILSLNAQILTGAYEVVEVLLETCHAIIATGGQDVDFWLQGLERTAKATLLGHCLPMLVTALTHPNLRCLLLAEALLPQLVQLVVLTSQAALLLKSQVQVVQQEELLNVDHDITDLIGGSQFGDSIDLGEEEKGFLAGLKVPAPWTSGKSVESVHPLRDNYKSKETVQIPGARCLFLRFDPRCSSQYDYDKLVVYAGQNTSAKKVAEFGGNTLGFGSRSVLGAGWPKDLVRVDGDSVTFSFEMRSGREHNTPDKAMWGFMVTVRAQESVEEVSQGLPFLADLALGLSVLACSMLQLLYQGPDKTQDEDKCQGLLKSRLLQRCVWQHDQPDCLSQAEVLPPNSPHMKPLPRIKMPAEIISKLREIGGNQSLQTRPSIREVIVPEVLEECILSATVKHLSLADTLRCLSLPPEYDNPDYFLLRDVMRETYRRHNAMLRQFQAIAELEQRWNHEITDVRQGTLSPSQAFFIDYHLAENKQKELAILCFLKQVDFNPNDLDSSVSALSEKLEMEIALEAAPDAKAFPRTQAVVQGVLQRLYLLLHVTIAPDSGIGRSLSQAPFKVIPNVMVRSDTDVLKPYARSISAPLDPHVVQDDSVLDIKTKRHVHRKPVSILQNLVEQTSEETQAPQVSLLHQLFAFIGSSPERAVSCESFLSAARTRWKRGHTRQHALRHMIALLKAATRVGGATHLVAAVTSVLMHGPQVEELTCGGMANHVREAFAEAISSVVQLVARYPTACCNSIGLLCVIPYTRAEEKCLVRSGLVQLLDRLCSLSNSLGGPSAGSSAGSDSGSASSEAALRRQRVSAMAWAGFQVLSNRCVQWEQEDGAGIDDLEHSGLARQVSMLLTNHLARATESSNSNQSAGNEALQEVLSLLNNLSRSKMGRAILSQPGCVSKLLSLLLDQRPSPKLVLIILQLCRVALPLMSTEDCDKVDLPAWGQDLQPEGGLPPTASEKSVRIASLLLAKLGDFLVPGDQTTIVLKQASDDLAMQQSEGGGKGEKAEDSNVLDGCLSVFVHKRADQSSHEVIQPLLSSGSSMESRPFRLAGGANMEKVVRMDREITKHGKTEVCTEEALSALRAAAKWAAMGLVVSTGAPVDSRAESCSSDKKKMAAEVCKDKNSDLSRSDPIRPFISGHVANSMAAEVIDLLHCLLSAPETLAAQRWSSAVESVLSSALSSLPILLSSTEDLGCEEGQHQQLITMAKQANAALAALGGFVETVKAGCEVEIQGEGVRGSLAQVLTVSEQAGMVTAKLLPPSDHEFHPPRYSDNVQVPISRLRPPRNQRLPLHQLSMAETIVAALQSLLHPQHGVASALSQPLPILGADATDLPNQICRVVAEIRTRACKVLACHLQDDSFARLFIMHSSSAIDVLKSLSKECSVGVRLPVEEAKCHRLRMLYRDCAKPPPPPPKHTVRATKEITWDAGRLFPPLRSTLFSHSLTAVTFLGDPSAGSGLPRGTLVFASQPIPTQAPSFYWEMEICSYGENHDESGPIISFGFMPSAEKRDGAWTNPVGSCLFHNNGRAVHYNGASLLQWRSVRLDVTLSVGDLAGIGWQRQPSGQEASSLPNHCSSAKGLVFFTHNGRRLQAYIDDVSGGMFPVVHIQKKSTRVRANFGGRPFAYAEGTQHRNAADDCHDLSLEIKQLFSVLPFHSSGSESDTDSCVSLDSSADSQRSVQVQTPPGPPRRTACTPQPLREYNCEASLHYKLLPSYECWAFTGPEPKASAASEEESDCEEGEEDGAVEDHYALLVKAWEQKVFPTIRRRFRNEAERKDGLEQIRGALQLGMTDIARQTVEFLYEENGGMPRDLLLPTIDDIKAELAKFTIDRVRKGTTVIIRPLTPSSSPSILPKFAVRGMLKTFSLPGMVLDVDQVNELVQVESYLQSEGVLVRFWYPLEALERPPQGYRKTALMGHQPLDTSSILIHREVLSVESVLARMHCRSALLELIAHCNSPSPPEASLAPPSMAASAALLQDLDIENLQLLSNELLAPPLPPHGDLSTHSLVSTPSPGLCLSALDCTHSALLYQDSRQRLRQELRTAISRAAVQGEDYLIELSNQICLCFQTAPELFPFEEFAVSESRMATDVVFPGCACVVVSSRVDPKASKKDVTHKSPWARIFTYQGHRISRAGQCSKQEVLSFPRNCSLPSTHSGQYCPAVIPADVVHLKMSASSPGPIVSLHGIPSQFPLAVAYIETLVSQEANFVYRKSDEFNRETEKEEEAGGGRAPIVVPSLVLVHVTKLICGYLWRTDVPPVLKETMFHLLAQTLRVLHMSEMNSLPSLGPQLSSSLAPLSLLQSEIKRLYEEETKGWLSGGGSTVDQGRFSTYFHSLMEVCLAVAEVTAPVVPPDDAARPSASSLAPPSPSSPASSTLGKRKKIKAKRDRTSSSSSAGKADSECSLSSIASTASSSSSSSSGGMGGSSKPEDMLWFHRALTVSQIFRYLIYGDLIGKGVTEEAVGDAYQLLAPSSAHSRLLIIGGIPSQLEASAVREAIMSACAASGGLFKDDALYLPKQQHKEEEMSRYAVLEVRSASKMDAVKRSLKMQKALVQGEGEEMAALDLLSLSIVNPGLGTDPIANSALESFLTDKLIQCKSPLSLRDEALIALTEIFHSCFLYDGQSPESQKLQSGLICLSRHQITVSAASNLICVFLNSLKATSKKTFAEQVGHLLRRYGVPRLSDKEDSDKKAKVKKASKASSPKEKMALQFSTKPISKEKRAKTKEEKGKSVASAAEQGAAKEASCKELSAKVSAEQENVLTLDGFLCFVTEKVKQEARSVWRALFACGYDLHFERCRPMDVGQAVMLSERWTPDMDAALVTHINALSSKLAVSPSRLHPHEVYLSASALSSSSELCALQGLSPEDVRLRFSLLQSLNNTLQTFFLPLVDLRPCLGVGGQYVQRRSCASLLAASSSSSCRQLIFRDTKMVLFNRVLNATAQRKPDQAAPEIVLDPLESVGGEKKLRPLSTHFCQALRQLSTVPSSQLCVRLAAGGDPTYAFNVRFTGEEVHGTSGSFRHFLWQTARELESPLLGLFMQCPSAGSQHNRGMFIMRPGPMTFAEEQLLLFLGQLIGVTIRADIPYGLDLLPLFWKNLTGRDLDPLSDLQDADITTYFYLKKIEMAESESELLALCSEQRPTFTFNTLLGDPVDLIPNGSAVTVTMENRHEFVECIRSLRMKELRCEARVRVLLAGMSSVIPPQLLPLLTPLDMELRTCGLPHVDLDFLRAHTMYQVGLMEADEHVQFFWQVMQQFSQEELCKFIKFACNQERIPQTCPCRDGGSDTAHVPPYPMKIAPPDGPGQSLTAASPDARFIRVETCMFMIKLPQYSSRELMRQRLLYAIHCRDDPLSG